jgi:hypothetical protein
MATIRARKQADGSTRYTAIVRMRKGRTLVHHECKTFTRRSAALTWAKHREVALEDPAALLQPRVESVSLADLIRWYIENFQTISKWQRSKQTRCPKTTRPSVGGCTDA